MPSSNVKQKKEIIDRYNAQLKLEQIQKDVANGNQSTLKQLAPLLESGSIGYASAASTSSSSSGSSYDSSAAAYSSFGSGGGGGGSDNGSEMDSSFDHRSQSTARRFEVLCKTAQEKIGREAIGEILSAQPPEAADDNKALSLQIRSYREAMLSIMAQLLNRDKVREDFAEILSIEDHINIIAPGQVTDDQVGKVVSLMNQANLITDKYKKTPANFGAIREKMTSSSAAERRRFLDSCITDLFIQPMGEEFDRVKKIEHIAMSVKCTNTYEYLIKTLEDAGVFSAKDCGKIVDYLLFARARLLRANQDVDMVTLNESKPFYERQLKDAKAYVGNVFERTPLTLTLFKHPRALLMLKNNNGEYSYFGRIENDLQYLSIEQKKALFVLLYEVNDRFREFSEWYTGQNFNPSVVQAKDISDLISTVREQIKNPSEPKKFTPGKTDKENLVKFSDEMEKLVTGEKFKSLVIKIFESNRKTLRSKLEEVTREGIITSGQSSATILAVSEVLDLVTAPDSSFQVPSTTEEYDSLAILVTKMASVGNTLLDEALMRRLRSVSKSGSSNASAAASLSPSPSMTPNASNLSLASIAFSSNAGTLSPSPSPSSSSSSQSKSRPQVMAGLSTQSLDLFSRAAARKNLKIENITQAQQLAVELRQKFASVTTLSSEDANTVRTHLERADNLIATGKFTLAAPLLEIAAGILVPTATPKIVIPTKKTPLPHSASPSDVSNSSLTTTPPPAPDLDLVAPVTASSSSVSSASSSANNSAADPNINAKLIQSINALIARLEEKRIAGIIAGQACDDTLQTLQELKVEATRATDVRRVTQTEIKLSPIKRLLK